MGGEDKMYRGYCFNEKNKYFAPVYLEDVQEAFDYINLQKKMNPRVIIVAEDDAIVLEALNGKITFPFKEE